MNPCAPDGPPPQELLTSSAARSAEAAVDGGRHPSPEGQQVQQSMGAASNAASSAVDGGSHPSPQTPEYRWPPNWQQTFQGEWYWRRGRYPQNPEFWKFTRFGGGMNAHKSIWSVHKNAHDENGNIVLELQYEAMLLHGEDPPSEL